MEYLFSAAHGKCKTAVNSKFCYIYSRSTTGVSRLYMFSITKARKKTFEPLWPLLKLTFPQGQTICYMKFWVTSMVFSLNEKQTQQTANLSERRASEEDIFNPFLYPF